MDEAKILEIEALVRAWLQEKGSTGWATFRLKVMDLYPGTTRDEAEAIILPLVDEYNASVLQETPEPELPPPAAAPAPLPKKRVARVKPVVIERGMAKIDHLARMAARLEAYSLKPDPDEADETLIAFPVLYVTASRMLKESIDTELKLGASLLTMDRLRDYMGGLGDILHKHLGDADPDLRDAILSDWTELSARFARGESV